MAPTPLSPEAKAVLTACGVRCINHPTREVVAQQPYTVRYTNGRYGTPRVLLCAPCAAEARKAYERLVQARQPKVLRHGFPTPSGD